MNKSTIKNAPNPTSSGSGEGKHDLIDRQAALDALRSCQTYLYDSEDPDKKIVLQSAEVAIEDLPAVQPETAKRIVGKSRDGMTLWYQCDMCNEPVHEKDEFCPGCGRRLTDG